MKASLEELKTIYPASKQEKGTVSSLQGKAGNLTSYSGEGNFGKVFLHKNRVYVL